MRSVANNSKNIKINFIMPPAILKASGGYKTVYQYADYLSQCGNDICIYFDSREGENSSHLPKFIMVFLRKFICFTQPSWMKISKKIKKKAIYKIENKYIREANISICTSIDTAIKSYKENTKNLVHFIQGHENTWLSNEEVYEVYNYSIPKITISDWLYKIISNHTKENIYLVKNGVDNEIFRCKNAKRGAHTISFIYKNVQEQNIDMAISIFENLKNIYSDIEVYIYSSINKPDKIPNWINFKFRASEKDVAEILNKTRVFLCTSYSEGFFLPGLESMACGCAFVTTDCIGINEYCINEINSLISPVDDIEKMQNNIIRIFEDNILAKKISKNAIDTAKTFSLSKKQEEFRNIIAEITDKFSQ